MRPYLFRKTPKPNQASHSSTQMCAESTKFYTRSEADQPSNKPIFDLKSFNLNFQLQSVQIYYFAVVASLKKLALVHIKLQIVLLPLKTERVRMSHIELYKFKVPSLPRVLAIRSFVLNKKCTTSKLGIGFTSLSPSSMPR